jgi:hypothetical protein
MRRNPLKFLQPLGHAWQCIPCESWVVQKLQCTVCHEIIHISPRGTIISHILWDIQKYNGHLRYVGWHDKYVISDLVLTCDEELIKDIIE